MDAQVADKEIHLGREIMSTVGANELLRREYGASGMKNCWEVAEGFQLWEASQLGFYNGGNGRWRVTITASVRRHLGYTSS